MTDLPPPTELTASAATTAAPIDRPADTVAVVTGGGRGIGRGVARSLAAAGARVAVVARTGEELDAVATEIRAAGGTALAVVADLTDATSAREAIASVDAALGPVTLLVNSAGVGRAHGPIWEGDPEAWCRDVEVGLRMVVLPTHAVLGGMVERARGRIVTVSSRRALQLAAFTAEERQAPKAVRNSSYSGTKAAVHAFLEQVAVECAPLGIPVLTLDPGRVRTALTDDMAVSGGVDPGTWLPWSDDGERAAALVVRMAAGGLDHLTGCLVTAQGDPDAVEPLLVLGPRPPT